MPAKYSALQWGDQYEHPDIRSYCDANEVVARYPGMDVVAVRSFVNQEPNVSTIRAAHMRNIPATLVAHEMMLKIVISVGRTMSSTMTFLKRTAKRSDVRSFGLFGHASLRRHAFRDAPARMNATASA
jgi:hypothetical protein